MRRITDTIGGHQGSAKRLAVLGLFTTAIIWGSTFPAGKIALEYMSPFYLMGFRFLIAFLVMAVLFRKDLFAVKLKNLTGGAIAGLFLGLGYALQIYGLQFTTAGKQSFLAGAYVIVVPFLTWIVFKKSPSIKAYLAAALCFWGIGMITMTGSFHIGIGDSITLLSSGFYAGHIVVTGYYASRLNAAVFTATQFAVGGVLALAVALATDPFPVIGLNNGMLAIVYLAVFGSFVAYYLQTVCQKYVKPSVTSLILSMEAVFGCLLSLALLGDVFTLRMAVGAAAMIVSVWISEL